MPLPTSGAISFSQLQAEIGGGMPILLSAYYRGGALLPVNADPNAQVPLSGTVSLSQFYGLPIAPVLSPTAYMSACDSEVSTPVLDLSQFLPASKRVPGAVFYVTTKLSSCTAWIQYPTLVGTFIYGTWGSVQSPWVAGKQFYMRITYDGANAVQGHGWYAGNSTNYPQGQLYIHQVSY